MSETERDSEFRLRIKVIGIGGAGCNAVANMACANLRGVDLAAVNTDVQALSRCRAHEKIQIGAKLTKGLGSGSKPEIGRRAAEEDRRRIRDSIGDANLVFIVAGLGGGTGTGGAPVVAEVAHQMGALAIAVVTRPFKFEGERRNRQALEGAHALLATADSIVTISNEKLFALVRKNMRLSEAFRVADAMIAEGIRAVSELVGKPGLINLDFADVRTIMSHAGPAVLGIGKGRGAGRAEEAAREALSCPLLEKAELATASGLLLNVAGGRDLTLSEVHVAADTVCQGAGGDTHVIFGATVDESLRNELKIVFVATGLAILPPRPQIQVGEQTIIHFGRWSEAQEGAGVAGAVLNEYDVDEDLDVPTFMRRAR